MKKIPIFDKQEDFAHNYIKIRIKCPECLRTTKGVNHVRVFKNISGVWWHLKTEHGEISNRQFTTDELKEILKKISKAVNLGIL